MNTQLAHVGVCMRSRFPVLLLQNANRLFNESTGKNETTRAEAYCIILLFHLFTYSSFFFSSLKNSRVVGPYILHAYNSALELHALSARLCVAERG